MTEKIQYIPARLKNAAQGGHVTGSEDIDAGGGKTQQQVNNEASQGAAALTQRVADLEAMEQIVIDGGEAQIATGSDFTNPDAAKRAKVATVGAVLDGMNDGIYDVSLRFPAGGPNSDGKFTLDYILNNANTLIPTSRRHGGMIISFVHSSDNNYMQYRCMANEFTTDVTKWQGVDAEPTAGSKNLVESGGITNMYGKYINNSDYIKVEIDRNEKIIWAIKSDGTIFFGAGVPPQVVEYIENKIEELQLNKVEDIVDFLGDIIEDDETLQELLDRKVDGEYINSPEWYIVVVDQNRRIIEGRKKDGTKIEFCNTLYPNGLPSQIQEALAILQNEIDNLPSCEVDNALSISSIHPVQNKVLTPILQNTQMSNHKDSFDRETLDWIQNQWLEDKYWPQEQSAVEAFISKFSARAGSGKYQIAVISDTHGSGSYTYSGTDPLSPGTSCLRSIAIFNKIVANCNAGIHGGDVSCDYGTSRLRDLEYMRNVIQLFKFNSKPLFITKGNHDENNNEYKEADLLHIDWENKTYYLDNKGATVANKSTWRGDKLYEYALELVSDREFANIVQHWHCPANAVWGNGAYYYYDIDSAKIRVIVGNSFPVSDEYTDASSAEYLWLAQEALNFSEKDTPADWSVLMLRHTQATSITDLADCINAFRNGSTWTYGEITVDFGDINGGGITFIGHVHGHEHHYCFSNGAGFFDIGETISCTYNLGTPDKYGLSVWTIDTVNKKIIEDTISGKTWIYNYDSGRLEIHRGESFEGAESGLRREVTASCSEPTITCSGKTVTIGNDTPYGNYTIVMTGSNGNTLNYLISVIE